MKEKWMVCNKVGDFPSICKEFGIGEPTARLLVNRGVKESAEIREFLYPSLNGLVSADLLPDAEAFCRYMEESIRLKRRIRVFGDYDVDGVCGTYILVSALKGLGAQVDYRIPHRRYDGYGISDGMVDDAIRAGIEVMVTVDNGISGHHQVEMARAAGMLVLITDHHEPGEKLPDAQVICDPKRKDSNYPGEICGAVVAAKLMELLYQRLQMGSFIEKHLDVMALATECDVMKLSGENRTMVRLGIESIRRGDNLGLKKLLQACKIEPEKLSAYHLGFVLGPCVNAVGRLDHAKTGVELLLSSDEEEAAELAQQLYDYNEVRKEKTNQMVDKALGMLKALPEVPNHVITFYLPECDESLAGIVAGKVREACYRPVIVLTDSEDEEMLKGSARSIDDVSIFKILQDCSDLLAKFGGHEQAAGLSLKRENLSKLLERMEKVGIILPEFQLKKRLIDIVLPFSYLNEDMIAEMNLLEPFGTGNPQPLFAKRDCQVYQVSLVGRTTSYVKLVFLEGEQRYEGIYFGNANEFFDELKAMYGEEIVRQLWQRKTMISMNLLYSPQWKVFREVGNVEIVVKGYQLLPQK